MRPTNLTLIGMPGSGKTTVGRIVAAAWGWHLLDTDQLIESGEGKRLEELIAAHGMPGFLAIEARHIRTIHAHQTVIATGGSVVYDDLAMNHLAALGSIVYLDVPLNDLTRRLGDLAARGVVIAPGMTLADLWAERHPLYLKYAHHTVAVAGDDPRESADAVLRLWPD